MVNTVGSNGITIRNHSARAASASCGRCKRQPSRARLAECLAARFCSSADMWKARSSCYEHAGRKSLYGRCRITGPSFDACLEYPKRKEKISQCNS